MNAPTIRCASCGTELYDPPEAVTAESGRPPCPTCGATERVYTMELQPGELKLEGGTVDVTVSPSTLAVHASIFAPEIKLSDPAWRSLDELATSTTARTLLWHGPNEHGDVLCEVRDEDGRVLGVNVGSDLDDAILNLAEQLKPGQDG